MDFLINLQPLSIATITTLLLAIVSLIVGLILAFVFTSLESVKFKPVAWFFSGFVLVIRGLPEVLVVIAIYNGIPMILNLLADGFVLPLGFTDINIQVDIQDFDVNPLLCGVIALSLLYASYASQTLRGAFKSISTGQRQAAEVLGLSRIRTLTHIIIPQIWRYALPGLGNQWLVLLKDTALVSLISVNDIMMQTRNIVSHEGEPFNWYLIAAAIYLVISILSQKLLKHIEIKTLYYDPQVKHD